ncbi:hypothetical protein EPUS_04612 [Endocarpon pusillum Z07020]|uniref:Glycosyl hydrolase family 13 catalytic domain-containing protein n=1 Tax=Endocarpon pusillum (strain Z07020 / HMAS-L-300199) TaxID=1263415 RepID=U1GDH7_ENDPU|nr:uncharacterized protein EPUS_04612 [Endocarpon pusillum Z07020]ERF75632.1 hypothetical protein EPUS_04612 [Endocarpon pusillum Z07020]
MAPFGLDRHEWWKEQTIYQIYPSSFQDSNGDGWGDIKGITRRLDYLRELGADTLWSSPFLKSPRVDMGYDISDFKGIDPSYGTMEDVDNLLAELKKRHMRMLMDLVVNHTSDQHAWFRESRSSLKNSKRDWYIWKKPKMVGKDGTPQPPNNWSQILGEASSAWNYDEITGEYYLGLFTPEQPDLNWENPEVRQAVYDVMHFWLKKGASGFRMDVINLISKVTTYPDAEKTLGDDHEFHPGNKFFVNGPRFHEYMQEMNREVLSKYDCYTVGESPGVSDLDEILRCVEANAGELNTQFIFDLVDMDFVPGAVRMALHPWDVKRMKSIITKYQRAMIERDGWNTVFIENHDNPRSVSRFTDDSDRYRDKGAKLLALMQTTLSGTLFVYQGEEIGMRNVPKEWDIEEYKDIESINFWKKSLQKYGDDPKKMAEARDILEKKARDNSRTPMQ